MKTENDYVSGPHDYWTHFWFGIVAGAGTGLWISSGIFDSNWIIFLASVGASIACGLIAGRYGDRFWRDFLRWWGE